MKRLLAAGGGVLALAALASTLVVAQYKPQLGFFITSANPARAPISAGSTAPTSTVRRSRPRPARAAARGARISARRRPTASRASTRKDRIGAGPWFNAKGVKVADSVADLHSDNNKLSKENSLTEKGEVVNGRGDTPNKHDMMTGSQLDGTAFPEGQSLTCNNWTSSAEGAAQVGHHDRQGGGTNPTSWNSAHASKGCSQEILRSTGGDGLFYCFAAK